MRAPDATTLAQSLGISREAADLYLSSDVIDLHIDTFIWHRMGLYDLRKRHTRGLLGTRLYGQTDLPRLQEAHVSGGIWSITTNPYRGAAGRPATFRRNLASLEAVFASVPDTARIVRNRREYDEARRDGRIAAFLGIQGGNALDSSLDDVRALASTPILKVTLVHLSTSTLGVTSAPPFGLLRKRAAHPAGGLTDFGRDYVRALNEARIFVDLAHISRQGFFDALAVHDREQPAIVSHTGVSGVTPHWRNLDDEQLRAIAATGGVVGVMYQSSFLGGSFLGGRVDEVAAHLDHVAKVAGEDSPALGSDWDGAILPPWDMSTCLELPRLVEALLRRGWKPESVRKALGGNFLRALSQLRP